jgi:hypothetical protein
MEPNKNIPPMEPFFSVEERMKLILNVIKHVKITFADAYKLTNLELTTLSQLMETENRGRDEVWVGIGDPYEADIDILDEDIEENEPEPLIRTLPRRVPQPRRYNPTWEDCEDSQPF